jgi:nucleoside 2-deoxyribosyltransferase
MKVYLAGPINGRTDSECKDWRALATTELGADNVFDPMVRDYRGREGELGIAKAIVEQDKADIDASSDVLVYFDSPSVGTAMEILYAWQRGKRVWVCNVSGKAPSPWLVYHSRCIQSSLADTISAVQCYHARTAV